MNDRDNIVSRLWAEIDDIHMGIVELKEELIDIDKEYLDRKTRIESRIAELHRESFEAYSEILKFRAAQSEPEAETKPSSYFHDRFWKYVD